VKSLSLSTALLLVLASLNSGVAARAQDDDDPAKAAALIREAIAARGGEAYLSMRSVVSRGQYTPYEKGVSGDPMSFVDYVLYPGRERTEFGKGSTKFIQANSNGGGWVYDANQKMIRDQKEDQIRQFEQGQRYDLDNLFRTLSQKSGFKLVYLGRREAWRNTFTEAVRVDFSDGSPAILHFDPRSKLPMMIEYKTLGEEGPINNEVRYFRWIDFSGIQFPTIQDTYRNGKQSNRVSYDTFVVNSSISEKLFDKPSNIKEVK
jgi:hypothetical protein